MNIASGVVFEPVPKFVPETVGAVSGESAVLAAMLSLVILLLMGLFRDVYDEIGYAHGFALFIILSLLCVGITVALKLFDSESNESADQAALH